MSDPIKHECGIALIRLLKPLAFYREKYGSVLYGLNKLYVLMEKQHNRGQDGAGIGSIKLNATQGHRFMSRYRSNSPSAIAEIFQKIYLKIDKVTKANPSLVENVDWLKNNVSFVAEMMLGHLRYGTYGRNEIDSCHPFVQNHQSSTRALIMAGNFNLTNIEELGWREEEKHSRPDTAVVLDRVTMHLENEIVKVVAQLHKDGIMQPEFRNRLRDEIDFKKVLRQAAAEFDGGYVLAGLSGAGYSFVMRDPSGIRPAFYYQDDEVLVVASERPAIQTAFNVTVDQIKELKPGHAVIADRKGKVGEYRCAEPRKKKSCSFERIYFSRGSDKDIYEERKNLGRFLVPSILKAIDYDFQHTVFSFIPNTAEVAFYGLMKGIETHLNEYKFDRVRKNNLTDQQLKEILDLRPRVEKIAIKDAKMRTFITQDAHRNALVEHVYDITYGSIQEGEDTIVVIDDSIVRGTTLKRSIIKMLDRLGPKKIIIVSSAPQIRYPDCYGIDMSKMKDFVAFRALLALLKKSGKENSLDDVYEKCKQQMKLPANEMVNEVKSLYDLFTEEEIADEVALLVKDESVHAEVQIIFQTVEDLHRACPKHLGDWYFSGDYPTPGGNKVVNRAFMNFMEGKDVRAYS
ncbi:MAG TPA: amidophosphoribosyltransferase [Chitinophagales bacterium]|nr:amidophosphoribosyltransferase [Chitinophagales bacterium]